MYDLFKTLLNTLGIEKLGFHLKNYGDLYSRPAKVWKKIIYVRKDGYDLWVLHIIYYCVFLILILNNPNTAIFITFLEIGCTVFPFLIFLIPFVFFNRIFKKRYKANKLFRLLVILKLQFLPMLVLVLLFNKSAESESLYILSDNILGLVWISFIVVFPSLIKANIWGKLIWIVGNYVCFLLFITLVGLFGEYFDVSEKISRKMILLSPNFEYSNFMGTTKFQRLLFDDSHYFAIMNTDEKNNFWPVASHYVSLELLMRIKQKDVVRKAMSSIKLDSTGLARNDSTAVSKLYELKYLLRYYKDSTIRLSEVAMYHRAVSNSIDSLFGITKTLDTSAFFERNRLFFRAMSRYLQQYKDSYASDSVFRRIVSEYSPESVVEFSDSTIGVLYKLDSNYYSTKSAVVSIEERLDAKLNKSMFIFSILFYPVQRVFELFD